MSERDRILAACARRKGAVTFGDQDFAIIEPSAGDMSFSGVADPDQHTLWAARLIARCLVDDKGIRVYTDEDITWIDQNLSAEAVGTFGLAIVKLTERAGGDDDDENPSDEADVDTSPSASH